MLMLHSVMSSSSPYTEVSIRSHVGGLWKLGKVNNVNYSRPALLYFQSSQML